MASKENLIGMASTNTSPLVAPTRSQNTVFGTNPIAVSTFKFRLKYFQKPYLKIFKRFKQMVLKKMTVTY